MRMRIVHDMTQTLSRGNLYTTSIEPLVTDHHDIIEKNDNNCKGGLHYSINMLLNARYIICTNSVVKY